LSTAVEKSTGRDKETVTSRHATHGARVADTKVLPASINDHLASTQTTVSPPSVDKSGASGSSSDAGVVGNGHVTNMASNFRLAGRTTRGEDDEIGPTTAPPGKQATGHHNAQYQQQQKKQRENNDGTEIDSQFPHCFRTLPATASTPADSLVDDVQHHRHHQQQQQQPQQQQRRRQQHSVVHNLPSANCSRMVSSTEKSRISDNHLHSTHHQQKRQQQQQGPALQNLRSQPLNGSNTINFVQKKRIADDEVIYSPEKPYRDQKQAQRQERQRNAASKNWNESTTMILTDTVPRGGDQGTRRPPVPSPTVAWHHAPAAATSLLTRTPSVGDGRPEGGAASTSTAQDSHISSTLPRAKFQQTTRATNGDILQRQAVPSSQANTAVRPPFYLPDYGRPSWLGGHSAAAPTSKSKDATPMIRDRVQFFTRSELAAAVASSDSAQTTTPASKPGWLRRKLFK